MAFRYMKLSDEHYRHVLIRFGDFFEDFRCFVETSKELTEELEITLDKDDSYTRYLVRLFVIAEETTGEKIEDPRSDDTIEMIKEVVNDKNFNRYNSAESGVPGRMYEAYQKFVGEGLTID
ncbi:hypothetical protein BHU61_09345 [Macrococcus epidermidis]|uniref:Uncharacterized protein n=1 Tax=Macrococcus epidermidis TaxID=1902580 RepID=A0A327ZQ29_9STAP|nr:hypothetical protein [Macrococcus epidermidis]RAK44349.1 hypothetical protein BHU61_09345 [Macrococcus epidermidis]